MESNKLDDELYELQYYEFTSSDFTEQFRDLVLETTKDVLEEFRKQVILNLPQDAVPLYNRQSDDLYCEYQKVLFELLKEVEESIREYFAIPKHVLLPGDFDNLPCPRSDIDKLEGEIRELELEYKKKRAIKYLLEKEIETLNTLENLNKKIESLTTKLQLYRETTQDDSVQNMLKLINDLSKKMLLMEHKQKFVIRQD